MLGSRISRRAAGTAAALIACATCVVGGAHADEPAPAASDGCAAAAAPGESLQQFAAAGKAGSYILDVPNHTGPLPVVVDLHGYMEPAVIAHDVSGLSRLGAEAGFVTVTPQFEESGAPRWDFGPGSADIAYLSDLLTHVESTLCVDRARVYVAGMSMGAFTASSIACQLSGRVAAIAAVAGLQDFDWCRPDRAVPIIAFHGTADPIVAYTGGLGAHVRFLPKPDGTGSVDPDDHSGSPGGPGPRSIPDNAAAWARRNGCGTDPATQRVARDATLTVYACPAGADVELYSVDGGGHAWPGSSATLYPTLIVGASMNSISATTLMWDFFRAHPLRS
ncbi:alpha/beta hydrolase family esterase [Nocardia wallacei]|uniref:alpha/beta hydrolase family esterase n=1 Tax=Nocardia wallacei TaxID=480035 RepID=UPI002454CADF|nr:PHB depolymerase family esterase [Nocardia wallacei]